MGVKNIKMEAKPRILGCCKTRHYCIGIIVYAEERHPDFTLILLHPAFSVNYSVATNNDPNGSGYQIFRISDVF
jgi:hypothetical protein